MKEISFLVTVKIDDDMAGTDEALVRAIESLSSVDFKDDAIELVSVMSLNPNQIY
jgi:hypothetical protein